MTKIGEGQGPVEEPKIDQYKKELEASSQKFLSALEKYNTSRSPQEQEHLRRVMDQQMALIQSAIKELGKKGFHKNAGVIAKDYLEYKEEETNENYNCLHNDVETLRERNKSGQ